MMKIPTIPMYEQVSCTNSQKCLRVFLYCREAHNDGVSPDLQSTELRHFIPPPYENSIFIDETVPICYHKKAK